jgi:RNA polymerase sigma-70 factor, ECF subfamily
MMKREKRNHTALSDLELASRIAATDVAAVRLVTGRNNQRLYRTAWSILKDRSEAEEAVQDGYMKAFNAIKTFAGSSSLSTWLTRIVVNEALDRRRRAQKALSHAQSRVGSCHGWLSFTLSRKTFDATADCETAGGGDRTSA